MLTINHFKVPVVGHGKFCACTRIARIINVLVWVILAAVAFTGTSSVAKTDDYPRRAVSIIVPQTPGGTNDIVARLMAEGLSKELAGNFVVVNKGGAGGNIGTETAARSRPDGYTLLLTISTHVINPFVYKSVGYDPIKDFDPIALLAVVPTVLVAHPSFPADNISELVELAKKQTELIAYATGGNGTINHIAGEKLQTETGIKLMHVPYRGAAPALVDVLSGQVPIGFATLPSAIEYINSGQLKALGISGANRSVTMPSIPTIGETVPGFAIDLWVGLLGVAGTPEPILAKLEDAVAKILDSDSVKKSFASQGAELQNGTAKDFMAKIESDLILYKETVEQVGATVN